MKVPECVLGVTRGIGAKFQYQPLLAATPCESGPLRYDNQQIPDSSAKGIVIDVKVNDRRMVLANE